MFSSTWGVGHVFPMVPLAQALVRAGHAVRWVANEPACAYIRGAGLEARSGGLDASGVRDVVRAMDAITSTVPGRDRAALVLPAMFGEAATPPMLVDLLREAAAFEPDLMIHEPAELAAPLVAALTRAPFLTHSWGPAIPAAILSAAERRLAPLWSAHGLDVPPYAGLFTGGYLDICPPAVQFVPTDHIRDRHPLRPGLYSGEPTAGETATAELTDWMTSDERPLVYITLGTVSFNASAQQAAIDGAVAHGARVLVTVGPQADPSALDTGTSGDVRVEQWVPQSLTLTHAALVISHAGSGTFLGALAAGTPQLCLPQAADQFRNADAVTSSRTGITLEPETATSDAIAEAISRLLHDDEPRRAARAVAAEVREMPGVDQLVADLGTRALG
jgi:UDP:flavonoid glycosyltransferase YjiC (YdhE family)